MDLDVRVINEKEKEVAIGLIEGMGEKISLPANMNFESEILSYYFPVFALLPNEFIGRFKNSAKVKSTYFAIYFTDAAVIIPVRKVPFIIFGPGKIEIYHRPAECIELDFFRLTIDTLFNFFRKTLKIIFIKLKRQNAIKAIT